MAKHEYPTNANDNAAPGSDEYGNHENGLTKREHFAALALQGILAYAAHDKHEWLAPEVGTSWAVAYADALIAALNA